MITIVVAESRRSRKRGDHEAHDEEFCGRHVVSLSSLPDRRLHSTTVRPARDSRVRALALRLRIATDLPLREVGSPTPSYCVLVTLTRTPANGEPGTRNPMDKP